jgi:hypothetical protein
MKKLYPIVFAALLAAPGLQAHPKFPILINNSLQRPVDPVVRNFAGLTVQGPIEVFVKMGNTESVRMEGDEEAIASLIIEVRSGILIIRPKASITSWAKKYENKKIVAHVSAKTLTSLVVSGNSTVEVTGTVDATSLATTLSGSGKLSATVSVGTLTSVISGSGYLDIKGSADKADVTMSGAGRFSGKNLKVDVLNTRISGAGQINIHADESIDALISGSGQVIYSGNASVKKRVLGSGGVQKI